MKKTIAALTVLLMVAGAVTGSDVDGQNSEAVTVSVKNLQMEQGERVAGFEFHTKCGSVVAMRRVPVAWDVTIENDENWMVSVSGSLRVGAAAEYADFFNDFLVIQKCSIEDLQFSIEGSVYVTRDFENLRTIALEMKDFVFKDAGDTATTAFAGHLNLKPLGNLTDEQIASVLTGKEPLRFDLSQIPEGRRIDLATLVISVSPKTNSFGSFPVDVDAAIDSLGTLIPAVRSNPPIEDYRGGDEVNTVDDRRRIEFFVTNAVEAWRDGTLINNGFLVVRRMAIGDDKEPALPVGGADVVICLSVYYAD